MMIVGDGAVSESGEERAALLGKLVACDVGWSMFCAKTVKRVLLVFPSVLGALSALLGFDMTNACCCCLAVAACVREFCPFFVCVAPHYVFCVTPRI